MPKMSKPAPQPDPLWEEVQAARNQDIDRVARLLWGENSIDLDEPEALGIADTVLNRVGSGNWPGTLQEVLEQNRDGRYQFSPFNPKSPGYEQLQAFGEGHPYWKKYRALAEKAMEPGRKRSPFDHYYAHETLTPNWAQWLEGTEVRGRHTFGKEKPAARRRKAPGGAGVKVKR